MTDNPNDAPGFIAAAIHNLTQGGGTANGRHVFDPGLSHVTKTLPRSSSSSRITTATMSSMSPWHGCACWARRRARRRRKCRVFFRLFQAQTTNSDFNTSTTLSLSNRRLAVRSHRTADGRAGRPERQSRIRHHSVFSPLRATTLGARPTCRISRKDTPQRLYHYRGSECGGGLVLFGCWLDINQPEQKFLPSAPPAGNWDGPWTTQW